jgi:hypothetical protein
MNLPFTGRCLCGALSYRATEAPLFTVTCYCLACQRTSGTGGVSAFNMRSEALEIVGEVFRARRPGDSGQLVENGFCATCGSRMFSRSDSAPGRINVMAASLDEPNWYKPSINIYVSRAPCWQPVDRSIPCFDTVPSSRKTAPGSPQDG